jgi:hypothetical protein
VSVFDRVFHSFPSRRRRTLLAALALACGSGCERDSAGLGMLEGEVVRSPLTASAAGPSVEDLFSAGRTPIVTGWEDTPWRLESQECARCHAATHGAWSESLHARAWTDPLFQASYVREPLAWCRNCHAPLSAQESGVVAREQGISCAACHVRAGEIVGFRALPASTSSHAVQAVAGFGGSQLCAGCHQFMFPRATGEFPNPDGLPSAVLYSDQPMQNTIEEWRASGAAPCGTCHTGGHRWTGPTDEAWLEKQFGDGTLTDSDPGVVSLRVDLAARGHAFPTGDLFRALHLEVALDEAFERVWFRARYGREFDGQLSSASTFIQGGQSRDTRIPARRAAISATFDRPPAQQRLFARLRFFFHDRWVGAEWTPDTATARVVWSAAFDLRPETP